MTDAKLPELPAGWKWGRIDGLLRAANFRDGETVAVDVCKTSVWLGGEPNHDNELSAPHSVVLAVLDQANLNTTANELRERVRGLESERDSLRARLGAFENATRFYSIDGDGRFEEFETEDEARADAVEALDDALEGNLWAEGTSNIEYVALVRLGGATVVARRTEPADEDDAADWRANGWSEWVDNKILSTKEAEATK